MIKTILSILLVFIVLCCQRQEVNINPQLVPKLIVNGAITNQTDSQIFKIEYSSDINDPNSNSIQNATIQLEHLGNTYAFSGNDSGVYTSNQPFAGIPGEKFSVMYEIDTTSLFQEFYMPHLVELDSFHFNTQTSIKVTISSPVEQYISYKFFNFIIDTLNSDSLWIETNSNTAFPIINLLQGTNTFYLNANYTNSLSNIEILDSGLVKVEFSVIDISTGRYFEKLNNYFETVATTSLFANPPRFYSNQFYGITYGTNVFSVIDTL